MSSRASRVWLLLPVTIFAIIALTVGLVATGTVPEPYATPFFHLFFRGVLQMKAWLATAALVLACGQLLTAARIYELLRFPPKGRLYHALHRWSGRMAILLTLPVAYHCIFMLGFSAKGPRTLAAGVGPLRSRRRESARRPIEQVRNLGTSGGRRSSVLDPSRAVAYFGVRVLCRYYPGHVTVVQPLMRDRNKKSPHPRPLALVAL